MEKPLSALTQAELARGAETVKQAVRVEWAIRLTRRYQSLAPGYAVTVWVTHGGSHLRVRVYPRKSDEVLFEREELGGTFPIDEIAAQIMLGFG